jgi:hypothetical protein
MTKLCSSEGKFILAVFCMDYHSGQWSRGYRLLSRMSPRNFTSELCNELRETELYIQLEEKYSNKV